MPTLCRHMSLRRAKRNGVAVDSTASRNGYLAAVTVPISRAIIG